MDNQWRGTFRSSFDLSTVNLSSRRDHRRVMVTDSAETVRYQQFHLLYKIATQWPKRYLYPQPTVRGVAPTCTSTAQDPDGDSVTSSIAWTTMDS